MASKSIPELALSRVEAQALNACLPGNLVAEYAADDQPVISLQIDIPQQNTPALGNLFVTVPVQSHYEDIQSVYRRLIESGFITIEDDGQRHYPELTLLGSLSLTKYLHNVYNSHPGENLTACLAASKMPRDEIHVDADLLMGSTVTSEALLGVTEGEAAFNVVKLLSYYLEEGLFTESEEPVVLELQAYARAIDERIANFDFDDEEQLYSEASLAEQLMFTALLYGLHRDDPLLQLLIVHDSTGFEGTSWYCVDFLAAEEAREQLLNEDDHLQVAAEKLATSGEALLLLEVYDRDPDPTIPLSMQPAEDHYVRWAPTLEELNEIIELQKTLDDKNGVIIDEHPAALVQPSERLQQLLDDMHADEQPNPSSAIRSSSLHFLPTGNPLVLPLLGADETDLVADGPLNMHISNEAVFFSYTSGGRTFVTRLLQANAIADALLNSMVNPPPHSL